MVEVDPATQMDNARVVQLAGCCAPCLLAGETRQAVTVYAGNAVCGEHLEAAVEVPW